MEGKVGFWCKRNEMREGNACQETIVFYIMNIHQVNVEITPSFASLFAFLSRPQPLSLSFQVPATKASHHWISSLLPSCPGRISQQSNQWSNSWYLETDIVITSTQQHTLVLEVDYDLVFSRVMCIFLWIKVKCKLCGCYEILPLHCTTIAFLLETIFHRAWLVSKCTGLNCLIKLIIWFNACNSYPTDFIPA